MVYFNFAYRAGRINRPAVGPIESKAAARNVANLRSRIGIHADSAGTVNGKSCPQHDWILNGAVIKDESLISPKARHLPFRYLRAMYKVMDRGERRETAFRKGPQKRVSLLWFETFSESVVFVIEQTMCNTQCR
jgi:hypothetical protein